MSTVTLSLPDTLSTFVDQQVAGRGYDTSGDYLLDLIRADQDRQRLRSQLLDGARSPATAPADDACFHLLCQKAGQTTPERSVSD